MCPLAPITSTPEEERQKMDISHMSTWIQGGHHACTLFSSLLKTNMQYATVALSLHSKLVPHPILHNIYTQSGHFKLALPQFHRSSRRSDTRRWRRGQVVVECLPVEGDLSLEAGDELAVLGLDLGVDGVGALAISLATRSSLRKRHR